MLDRIPEPYPQMSDVNDMKMLTAIREADIVFFRDLLERVRRLVGNDSVSLTASKTIAPNDRRVDVDTTGGAVTITLPAKPFDGELHTVVRTSAGANNVTVAGNGRNINGGATASLTTQYAVCQVEYRAINNIWRRLI